MYYTIGQRQGLKIGGRKDANETPWYVLKKDLARNVLVVGQGQQHPLLFSSTLTCSQLSWVSGSLPTIPLSCTAKTRYRQIEQACTITSLNEQECAVEFTQPQWAITPGQSIVFYHNDHCLGGGIIN